MAAALRFLFCALFLVKLCQAQFTNLIFEDNFDFFDKGVWEHEITAGGGGVSKSTKFAI